MNDTLGFLSSVKFDAILLLVSVGYVAFAHWLLTNSAERDGSMALVLRKLTAALDAIPAMKIKGRPSRARQKSRPSPAE